MSRWTTPLAWAAASASAIWMARPIEVVSVRRLGDDRELVTTDWDASAGGLKALSGRVASDFGIAVAVRRARNACRSHTLTF
jgi:hypothetical protein